MPEAAAQWVTAACCAPSEIASPGT
eukprot:COSAG04_NODE_20459_length_393_cov_0.965986_1_plen_24_part_10